LSEDITKEVVVPEMAVLVSGHFRKSVHHRHPTFSPFAFLDYVMATSFFAFQRKLNF
jgi:hypothetical protein